MKKVIKITSVIVLTLTLFNCSSVQVKDSWKGVETKNLAEKNVLVLSKSSNEIIRKQFEIDMVRNLSKHNINSIESFKVFPNIAFSDEISKDEIQTIKKELLDTGIDLVLMTVLRDMQEYETTTTTGGASYYVSSYPVYYYSRGFYRGFYKSYNSVYIESDPTTYVTSKGKRFVLETTVYDLKAPENEQLISVITTKIENPETLGSTSKDFSKKIVKELVK